MVDESVGLGAGFAAAFLAGLLALLAPCSALLLPAFFAYAFAGRTALLWRSGVFLLGMCSVLVPLGMGVTLVPILLLQDRAVTVLVAGLLLVVFGVIELLGGGFGLVPRRLIERVQAPTQTSATYAAGLVYGMAGFCSGPLLGGVLTLAATGQTAVIGGALLFAYALGTVVPLLVLASAWDRYDLGRRRWLRGRPVRLGPTTIHTSHLLAGSLFTVFGLGFIASQGGSSLSGVYDALGVSSLGYRLEDWLSTAVGL